MSAASRINLAASTSALDVITRDSPNLLACAADESDSCKCCDNVISFTSVDSIYGYYVISCCS